VTVHFLSFTSVRKDEYELAEPFVFLTSPLKVKNLS